MATPDDAQAKRDDEVERARLRLEAHGTDKGLNPAVKWFKGLSKLSKFFWIVLAVSIAGSIVGVIPGDAAGGWIMLAGIIWLVGMGIKKAKPGAKKPSGMELALAEDPTFRVTYQILSADRRHGLAIDEASKRLALVEFTGWALTPVSCRVIGYREILSVEAFEDGESITSTSRTSQAAGALVGGVLLGGVGAVVGALSSKKVSKGFVSSMGMRLTIMDTAKPSFSVETWSGKAKRGSGQHKLETDSLNQWIGRISVLIKMADAEDKQNEAPSTAPPATLSVADELVKLAGLRDQGILSEQEFAAQKEAILSAGHVALPPGEV